MVERVPYSSAVIVVRPDAGTLARIRLAPSPAVEVVSWIRLAAVGGRHPAFGDSGAAARFALRDRDVSLVARAIGSGRSIPHLLTPTPTAAAWARGWADQLEQICQAPAELAADILSPVRGAGNGPIVIPTDVRRAVDAGSFARRAAHGLRRFYDLALAEPDGDLSSVAAADLAHRGQDFATRGLEHVLSTLHRDLRWTGTELHLTLPYDESIALTRADLVLMPTILFRWGIGAQLDSSNSMSLAYPARLVNTAHNRRRQGLPELVGPTRAAILRDLEIPRTTTDLSHRHTLAKSTVSHHLGILLHAGLVARARDGGTVFYSRTEHGDRTATIE
jgi:DNA-binding transcriptional ArsR family regulator